MAEFMAAIWSAMPEVKWAWWSSAWSRRLNFLRSRIYDYLVEDDDSSAGIVYIPL
jgi:hypothetical protein